MTWKAIKKMVFATRLQMLFWHCDNVLYLLSWICSIEWMKTGYWKLRKYSLMYVLLIDVLKISVKAVRNVCEKDIYGIYSQ